MLKQMPLKYNNKKYIHINLLVMKFDLLEAYIRLSSIESTKKCMSKTYSNVK